MVDADRKNKHVSYFCLKSWKTRIIDSRDDGITVGLSLPPRLLEGVRGELNGRALYYVETFDLFSISDKEPATSTEMAEVRQNKNWNIANQLCIGLHLMNSD